MSVITKDKSGSSFFTSVRYESKIEELKSYVYMITTREAREVNFWIFLRIFHFQGEKFLNSRNGKQILIPLSQIFKMHYTLKCYQKNTV